MENEIRTFRYRADISSAVHRKLEWFLEQQRVLHNCALQERIDCYQKTGKPISLYGQFKSLTEIRNEDPDFYRFHCNSQRTVLIRLDKAFKGYFDRLKKGGKPGFPRFKGGNRKIRSFETGSFSIQSQPDGKHHSVTVKGIGRVKFKGSVNGDPKLLRIVRKPRRTEVQLVCEVERVPVVDSRPAVGIDVGIKNMITVSDGRKEPKRLLPRAELKRRQRKLSKSVKGSNNRYRKKAMLAREWQRVTERERGHLHELTRDLVDNVSSRFFVEDLKIQNLVRNPKLSRSITEQNWGIFTEMLAYKAESAGGWVMKVNPKNTSRLCSECGTVSSA